MIDPTDADSLDMEATASFMLTVILAFPAMVLATLFVQTGSVLMMVLALGIARVAGRAWVQAVHLEALADQKRNGEIP